MNKQIELIVKKFILQKKTQSAEENLSNYKLA